MIQSSAEVEHELLPLSSESWTDAQQNPCTPTVTQGFAEHTCLPVDRESWEDYDFADPIDPIEDFSEDDHMAATGSMATAGRSPKHPRTGSEEDSLDIAALLDRAADRFSPCKDTKVKSMMDRLEKRIDERIDSKLGPVEDRLTALEKHNSSSRSSPFSVSDNGGSARHNCLSGSASPAVFAPYLEIKGWCGFRDRNTHGLTEAQAREVIAKLRQGIGPGLDSLIARVCSESQKYKDHLLFESTKPFELQADQGSNECFH